MFLKRGGILLITLSLLLAAGCGAADEGTELTPAQEDSAGDILSEEEAEPAPEELPEEEAPAPEETEAEPEQTDEEEEMTTSDETLREETDVAAEETTEEETSAAEAVSSLPGAHLNGTQFAEGESPQRVTYAQGFYYEPVSAALKDYITGTSYPETADKSSLAITTDQLRYVHVLYRDFDGETAEGELICNQAIAQDLVEIFAGLYENAYPIERIRLVDEYGGDDDASMAANNTSCFNYRVVAGSSHLSQHAYGLAVDINPLYNPYITYNADGSRNVSPPAGWAYADRSADFPYKIDTNDLCYRLFTEHGFTWGGSWNSSKDYQHFQK